MKPIIRNQLYVLRKSSMPGVFLLRLRLRWGQHSMEVATGHYIDRTDAKGRAKWTGDRCRPGTLHGPSRLPAVTINTDLEQLEERIRDAFYRFECTDHLPTPDELKSAIFPDRDKAMKVADYFDRYISESERTKMWAFNTVRSVRQVRNLVAQYAPSLTLTQVTREWLDSFVVYQTRHKLSTDRYKRGGEGYANNVILKNCRIFKWFLRWAADKRLISGEIVTSWHPAVKSVERPVVFLTWGELTRVEEAELPAGSEIDRVRDFFCFCCFTSLRYSDAAALRKSDIRDNWFDLVTRKTARPIRIDLNSHSRRILEKYAGQPGEFALPRLTNNRINLSLKQLGKQLGLTSPVVMTQNYGGERKTFSFEKWEVLSIHAARRTFVSNALMMGIPATTVIKWTGHTDLAALKPYLDIADAYRAEAMSAFDHPKKALKR